MLLKYLALLEARTQLLFANFEHTSEEYFQSFITNIIPYYLHRSVIAGEYYDENALLLLEKIIKQIDDTHLTRSLQGNEIDSSTKDKLLYKLATNYNSVYLNTYLELTNQVRNTQKAFATKGLVEIPNIDSLYYTIKSFSQLMHLSNDQKQEELKAALYQCTILLAFIDEDLECNDKLEIELTNVVSFLRSARFFKDITWPFLIAKAEFLLYKIKFRKSLALTHEEHKLIPPIKKKTEAYFDRFYEKILFHYSNDKILETGVEEFKEIVLKYPNQPLTDWTIEPFHHINRYYHKISSPPEQAHVDELTEYSKILKNSWKAKNIETYDKIAFRSVYNLFLNSILDMDLEIERHGDFINLLGEIKDFFDGKTNVIKIKYLENYKSRILNQITDNPLPEFKSPHLFAKFVIDFVDFITRSPQLYITNECKETSLKAIKEKSLALSEYLENFFHFALVQFKTGLENTIIKKEQPVYLTFKECKFYDNAGRFAFFLDSSYILPINYKTFKKDFESWKHSKSFKFPNLQKALEFAFGSVTQERNTESFEKKVKENEFKFVQIVAMFVSIATFVLINVKIFDNKTGIESFGIMLGLAACFVIFNLVLYFIVLAQYDGNRKDKGWTKFKVWGFLIMPIIFGGSSFLILQKYGDKNSKALETINSRLHQDSVTIERFIRPILNKLAEPEQRKDTPTISTPTRVSTNEAIPH